MMMGVNTGQQVLKFIFMQKTEANQVENAHLRLAV